LIHLKRTTYKPLDVLQEVTHKRHTRSPAADAESPVQDHWGSGSAGLGGGMLGQKPDDRTDIVGSSGKGQQDDCYRQSR
jgi:hypothetical protein